jgi:serine/threonine protein kinase
MSFAFGAQVGGYTIQAELGSGSFGTVYRVADGLGRAFAMKVLQPGLGLDALRRFWKEVKILRSLRHENLIEVLDSSSESADQPWFVMPIMANTLASLIPNDRSWEQVADLMRQAALGLAAYHSTGGVHRDIKPENLLLAEDGTVKVADFGIARCPAITGSTMTKSAFGTAPYMAPEVWQGGGCQESDVYALGIVFWELVNDVRHETPARPPRFLQKGPDFDSMQDLFERMTSTDPAKRPSAAAVAEQLTEFIAFLREEPEDRVVTFARGGWSALVLVTPILAIAAVIAILVGGIGALRHSLRHT